MAKDKGRLEIFDGTQPLSYRTWKRRAQLMLASLPSTIKKEQHGPKLMGYIGGEAEALLEQLEIEGICAENGDKAIWAILDDKYNPQPIDLLQSSLKTFFHELSVKPMETYRQFSARFAAAQRKLEEQKVVLPKVALGFLFMKKTQTGSESGVVDPYHFRWETGDRGGDSSHQHDLSGRKGKQCQD